jgi:hypothetical protein
MSADPPRFPSDPPTTEPETSLNGQVNAAPELPGRDPRREDLSDFIENAAVALHWVLGPFLSLSALPP